jgi:hypothetical protein
MHMINGKDDRYYISKWQCTCGNWNQCGFDISEIRNTQAKARCVGCGELRLLKVDVSIVCDENWTFENGYGATKEVEKGGAMTFDPNATIESSLDIPRHLMTRFIRVLIDNNEYCSVGALAAKSPEDIMKFHNIGRKTVNLIQREFWQKYGIAMGEYEHVS